MPKKKHERVDEDVVVPTLRALRITPAGHGGAISGAQTPPEAQEDGVHGPWWRRMFGG
jgi:hypothetical protein